MDLVILDAFSSDSIPSHLLTKEAFDTYWRSLSPDGLVLVHISNRHVDLLPVLIGAAKSSGARLAYDYRKGNPQAGTFDASWVALWIEPGLDRFLDDVGVEALDLQDVYSVAWQDEKRTSGR